MEISKRYVMTSQTVTRRLPGVMQARGLDTDVIKGWFLTAERGEVWLFAAVNTRKIERLERYTSRALLHQISTVCDGTPVVLSNSSGLRYCFLLSQRPRLPQRVDFPGCKRGVVRLGVGQTGQPMTVRWQDLGHLLVAGETRMGKSNLLRLIAHQALAEGAKLLLSDLSQTSFPMLAGHDALSAPIATTPEEAHGVVARALAECDWRAALYQTMAGFPDELEEYNVQAVAVGGHPLPRLLVILDEYNATAVANGGHRGQFCQDVAALCWQGLKFGVHVIVAAQDFEKRIVGRMRDQTSAVCFRVRSRELARAVGCAGAEAIPETHRGRAISDRWGPLQVYQFDKTLLTTRDAGGRMPSAGILSDREYALVTWALDGNDGYLALTDIQDRGRMGQYEARKLAREWERRGWLRKDGEARNKRRITPEFQALIYTLQTPQTATDRTQDPQGDRQTAYNHAG
jgi:hypothetical protein